ncbi:hypothetical protein SAMN02745229_01717 [Butyrivibrio fibrisolvens DSM 3071]|uniref:Uncharacterized protein n=1 Tax=Butyrivibrio fibrisolvens DSM 3071 TaxID=1121131 RepID=A0A1M5YUF8_BUTFI|nr:hypothetical protein [Butyrivibrio fibrisolvens]SHI15559.1 hypothetical protein SAMN02745229_01717 [Butyrivibrio fibrisolvens DSM 3071]
MGGKVLDLPGFIIYEQGIFIFIEDKIEDNISVDVIQDKLCKKYNISDDKAKEYIERVSALMKEKK